MPQVEVFEGKDVNEPLFTSEFAFLPRAGEYISKEMGGFFSYYNVIEVWYREDAGTFRACVRVQSED